MIVLGLIGRPDVSSCHDAAACLVADGRVIGALEQERLSRRRHAPGEGPEAAARVLLAAHGMHPSEVNAVAYAWADAPARSSRRLDCDVPCGVLATPKLTATILPSLSRELGKREMLFFDHHLCHAAQAYWLNPYETADLLVADGWGGDGSTSLFHVDRGRFRLLDRYGICWSLGVFYEAAARYANLGWDASGKLMGLSSYGRSSGRRFLTYHPQDGRFQLGRQLGSLPRERIEQGQLAEAWLGIFEASIFPYTSESGNAFDYGTFAADVQMTLAEAGLGLARRLRRLSGEDTLLLAGGVALNAHMNRLILRESGYRRVSGTAVPHDAGASVGAALLAASVLGEQVLPVAASDALPIFLGPPVSTLEIESALRRHSIDAEVMESERLRTEVARALGKGKVVAWFNGPSEVGPRALGARSLLASPKRRSTLDRLNRIKGRAPWRPASLSLVADGFRLLDMEPPVDRLTDYMLCVHEVGEPAWRRAAAGVHVDGTTRAQCVASGENGFGALLEAVGAESGLPAVINTSLNLHGQPIVLTPNDAVELMCDGSQVDVLVMSPYVARRC